MLDNRALVDGILTRRGLSKVDRERICGDTEAVEWMANVICESLSPDRIDIAVREYWASQKASDPADEQ